MPPETQRRAILDGLGGGRWALSERTRARGVPKTAQERGYIRREVGIEGRTAPPCSRRAASTRGTADRVAPTEARPNGHEERQGIRNSVVLPARQAHEPKSRTSRRRT